MKVPWSPVWNRLLEVQDFGSAEATEAIDCITTSLEHGVCPACGARNFGPTRWEAAGIEADTIVCLTCEIVWPPREVVQRWQDWDFGADPAGSSLVGATMVAISALARIIQGQKEPA
jgi:hypothetical protein